ncbi:ATP-binding protein [Actinoplanes couchii]|nr:ATP-binding protein [Actinoplanes couchii]MDR6324514.1 anti-sigma regulatory factor (Ser/Thr protein kinase) [Actinoplanes couchii]
MSGNRAPASDLMTSPPPPQADELNVWVLDDGSQLRKLRVYLLEAVNTFADSRDAELDQIAATIALVATELATNAIKHGLPPTVVRLSQVDDQFIVDVADHDMATFLDLADTRPVNAGGRGLHVARALSLSVGWYATDTTKHIWATFPIHS